ncbi:MAG: TraR/DksA C4-type zinc finger protein, partial [Caldilineaceae bacterium]|nr:TraR/DksA C4-type zinc finger protein [Caldilineaceae bacterium]
RVVLAQRIEEIVSRPGVRVNCDLCGEEIINERERQIAGRLLCQSCAGMSYYQLVDDTVFAAVEAGVRRM